MKFDIKSLKKNALFFIICIPAILFILVLSIVSGGERHLSEEELESGDTNVTKLIINEIMTSNKGTIAASDGKLYDYIEIYNGNNHEINLKNYGLSDETGSIKWTFPETIIESKSYLVVFLSGTSTNGLFASFKLKSGGGETLSLLKPNGKVIDAAKTVSLQKDTVMARNNNGEWVVQLSPTPGFSNTIEGHEAFINSLTTIEDGLIKINEILPNNKGLFKDLNGDFSGYIEVKNISDKTVDLENYSISNSESVVYKWQFPSIKISPNEVVVVFTSNRNIKVNELHASFKLNNLNGVVILSDNKGRIIQKLEYKGLANGNAYVLQGDKYLVSNIISPGYDNTLDGIKEFQKKYTEVPKDLIISEAMSKNYNVLPQNGGNYYDWLELYNNSSKSIKLSDYCLTTNLDSICMYKLPDVTLDSGKYYVIIASGDENLSNNSYKHTNFNISDTQSIYLSKSKEVIDSLYVSNVPQGYTMGKKGDYGVYYFSNPTPGASNANGTQAISYAPEASVKTGIYNDVSELKVELLGSGTIYYTTNGSNPTTRSSVYSSPLNIKTTTVLKTMCVENGKLNSEVKTYSYIVNQNHKIPVMSVIIDPGDLKQLHSHAFAEEYKKPCYAELIELDNTGFSIGAGLKLFGGSTRGHSKKSYELKFQKQYGPGKLHYQVFDNVDSAMFDSIVLRTGSQDEMGNASKKTFIRDLVGTALVGEYTTVDVQAYKPVAMYLNGQYWGLYFIREKIDETFVANHYNVNATKTNTDLLRIDGQIKSGSETKYSNMTSFISKNSLSNSNNYAKIKEQIDIENLCDFWIAETFVANNDILNVRYFSNPDVDGGKWKFIFYDLDFAFYNVNVNYFSFSTSSSGMTFRNFSTFLLRNLMKSSEFKKTYLERLAYNLKNTWNPDNFEKKLDEIIAEISEDEIRRNINRWKTVSYSSWISNISYLKGYVRKRGNYLKSQAKSFFGLSNSDMNKYFGG